MKLIPELNYSKRCELSFSKNLTNVVLPCSWCNPKLLFLFGYKNLLHFFFKFNNDNEFCEIVFWENYHSGKRTRDKIERYNYWDKNYIIKKF